MSRKGLLIIGGSSQIGSHLSAFWRRLGFETYATTRHHSKVNRYTPLLDLGSSICDIDFSQFSSAVLCAGVTSMAQCEADPEASGLINVQATTRLIEHLRHSGVHVVFLSATAVFDGKKPFCTIADKTNPRNTYGRQKVAVEAAIKEQGGAVLRVTKVINASMPLLSRWETELKAGKHIHAFSNRLLSPVTVDRVSEAITGIVDSCATGLFHLGGKREMNYFEFAREYFRDSSCDLSLIKPSLADETEQLIHNSLVTHLPD